MQKVDKEGNVTKEYIDFVEKLNRDDLERFYMGADFLKDELQQRINKAIKYIEQHFIDDTDYSINKIIDEQLCEGNENFLDDLLEILKGEDKK